MVTYSDPEVLYLYPDIAARGSPGIARVAQAWRDAERIRQAVSFVHQTGRSEVPGHDPAHLAASEWQYLRTEARQLPRELDWLRPAYPALIEAACAEPRPRALYPFTCHWTLRSVSPSWPGHGGED
jgi:hypothetical protein